MQPVAKPHFASPQRVVSGVAIPLSAPASPPAKAPSVLAADVDAEPVDVVEEEVEVIRQKSKNEYYNMLSEMRSTIALRSYVDRLGSTLRSKIASCGGRTCE